MLSSAQRAVRSSLLPETLYGEGPSDEVLTLAWPSSQPSPLPNPEAASYAASLETTLVPKNSKDTLSDLISDTFWYCCLTYVSSLGLSDTNHMHRARTEIIDKLGRGRSAWSELFASIGAEREDVLFFVENRICREGAESFAEELCRFQVRDVGNTQVVAAREQFKKGVSSAFQRLISLGCFYHNVRRESALIGMLSDTVCRLFEMCCSQSGIVPHCQDYIHWLLVGLPQAPSARIKLNKTPVGRVFGTEVLAHIHLTREEEMFDSSIRSRSPQESVSIPQVPRVPARSSGPRLFEGVRRNVPKLKLPLTRTSPAFQSAMGLELRPGTWSPRAVSLSSPSQIRSVSAVKMAEALHKAHATGARPQKPHTPRHPIPNAPARSYREYQEGQRRKMAVAELTVDNLNSEMGHVLRSLETKYAFTEDPADAIFAVERVKMLYDAAQESRDVMLSLPSGRRCELRERGAFLARLLASKRRDVQY